MVPVWITVRGNRLSGNQVRGDRFKCPTTRYLIPASP